MGPDDVPRTLVLMDGSNPEASGGPRSEMTAGSPSTALPPVTARVLAFLAVLIGGAAGGFIGYAFGSIGGFGSIATGILTLVCGLGFAGGVAVIGVLTLRALGEWSTIREQGPEAMRAARAARATGRS